MIKVRFISDRLAKGVLYDADSFRFEQETKDGVVVLYIYKGDETVACIREIEAIAEVVNSPEPEII